ncbi:hypothetical protein GLI01_33750 [Gluconacetobacter liquefaciens]|nr:hypothetical protein GLI01_33750 [Gluconacetobacter liquefaciens]
MLRLGTRPFRSEGWVMFDWSSAVPLMAVTAMGVRCMFERTCWTVTVTCSICGPVGVPWVAVVRVVVAFRAAVVEAAAAGGAAGVDAGAAGCRRMTGFCVGVSA